MIGSGGTLGVVTAVTVALTPIPRATETWWLAVDDPAVVVDVLTFLDGRRPGTISAFEYLSANALAQVLAAPGGPPNPFGDAVPAAAVLAEWTFADDGDHDLDTDLAAAAEHGLISDARLVQPAAGWALRHRVTESLRAAGVVLGHDVSVPRRDLMAMRDRAVAAIAGRRARRRHVRLRPRRRRRPAPQRGHPARRRTAVGGAGGGDPRRHRHRRRRARRQLQRRARPRPGQRRPLARRHAAARAAAGRRGEVGARSAPTARSPRPPVQPAVVSRLCPETRRQRRTS